MNGYIIFLITFILIVILYLFLIMPRMFHKPDRTPLFGVHYAHRGLFNNNSAAPENSLAAFKKAIEAGYGIEMDVQLSKDNIPVIFHDRTLERMCGIKGNVWDYTLAELKKFKLAYSHESIPTLKEALDTINGSVPLIIEYKLDVPKTKVCELSDHLLTDYPGVYCIESFHPFALIWYKKHRPAVIRGQLSMEYLKEKKYRKYPALILMTYLITNVVTRPDFIAYQHSDAANLSLRLARMFGALSVAWTIRSSAQYEAIKKHFDLFIFDSCTLEM